MYFRVKSILCSVCFSYSVPYVTFVALNLKKIHGFVVKCVALMNYYLLQLSSGAILYKRQPSANSPVYVDNIHTYLVHL